MERIALQLAVRAHRLLAQNYARLPARPKYSIARSFRHSKARHLLSSSQSSKVMRGSRVVPPKMHRPPSYMKRCASEIHSKRSYPISRDAKQMCRARARNIKKVVACLQSLAPQINLVDPADKHRLGNNSLNSFHISKSPLGKGSFGVVYPAALVDSRDKCLSSKSPASHNLDVVMYSEVPTIDVADEPRSLNDVQKCEALEYDLAIKKVARSRLNGVEMNGGELIPLNVLSSHPFIVDMRSAVFDGSPRSSMYLVMKRYNAGTLTHFLMTHPSLDRRVRKLMSVQLLLATAFLERSRIAHRDLKPDNVLVHLGTDQLPQLALSDFGQAIRLSHSRRQLVMRVGGNAFLRAPELVRAVKESGPAPGGAVAADFRRSDAWAAATLFFNIFNLKNPFLKYRDTPAVNVLDYQPEQLPDIGKLPAAARNVAKSLLDRDPENRIGTRHAATLLVMDLARETDFSKMVVRAVTESVMNKRETLRQTFLCFLYEICNPVTHPQ